MPKSARFELTALIVHGGAGSRGPADERRARKRAIMNAVKAGASILRAGGSALDAYLCVDADGFTPVDEHLIPTGEVRSVAATAFDFRTPHVVSARIRDGSEAQLIIARGYDHNFVLRGALGCLRRAARLDDPRSGRVLELSTTQPGLQMYTGNFLTGAVVGEGRRLYRQGDGIALETQHFPDSPNHAGFPSTELKPGQKFHSVTEFQFSTGTR